MNESLIIFRIFDDFMILKRMTVEKNNKNAKSGIHKYIYLGLYDYVDFYVHAEPHVCMHMYVYMHTCVYIKICIFIRMYIHMNYYLCDPLIITSLTHFYESLLIIDYLFTTTQKKKQVSRNLVTGRGALNGKLSDVLAAKYTIGKKI